MTSETSSTADAEVCEPTVAERFSDVAYRLKTTGLEVSDQQILSKRLRGVWKSEPQAHGVQTKKRQHTTKWRPSTKWRHSQLQNAYQVIQDTNDHLILPFVLAFTPTEIPTPTVRSALNLLCRDHKDYTLSLNTSDRTFLDSLAIAEPGYNKLIRALFPKAIDIPLTYGLDTPNSIKALQILAANLEQFSKSDTSGEPPCLKFSVLPDETARVDIQFNGDRRELLKILFSQKLNPEQIC